MKNLFLLGMIIFLIGCGKSIDQSKTQNRNGILYEVNVKTPFTGYVTGSDYRGTYKKHYENGKLDGGSIFYGPKNKIIKEENYKNGKLDGVVKEWHYGSKKLETIASYKEGKKDGVFRRLYGNGKVKTEDRYKEDKLNGVCKKWHENGQLSLEKNYKNGVIDGVSKEWYKNGQLSEESHYQNKNLVKLKKWSVDGVLMWRVCYKDGKFDGDVIVYTRDGGTHPESISEGIYKDGEKNGPWKKWSFRHYQRGNLVFEGNYVDGVLHGHSKTYYMDTGEVSSEGNYDYGEKVGVWKEGDKTKTY